MREYFIWLAKFATIVVVVFFIVPVLLIAVGAAAGSAKVDTATSKEDKIAVVEVLGVIMDAKDILKKLHKLAGDEKVKGIVLRIDSPGGAVGPSQEIYDAVRNLKKKKPIIASMGGIAASGGLYSALGATKTFAQSGTLTGSIGVIIQFPNMTKIANQVGFEMVTVKSGKLKDVGNAFRTMTPEDREFLQGTVNSVYEEFVAAVITGRKLKEDRVRPFADGRIITGRQALEYGLVDKIGGLYDAARAVYDELGEPLPEGDYPKLYYPEDKFEKFRKLLEGFLDLPAKLQGTIVSPQYRLMYMM